MSEREVFYSILKLSSFICIIVGLFLSSPIIMLLGVFLIAIVISGMLFEESKSLAIIISDLKKDIDRIEKKVDRNEEGNDKISTQIHALKLAIEQNIGNRTDQNAFYETYSQYIWEKNEANKHLKKLLSEDIEDIDSSNRDNNK